MSGPLKEPSQEPSKRPSQEPFSDCYCQFCWSHHKDHRTSHSDPLHTFAEATARDSAIFCFWAVLVHISKNHKCPRSFRHANLRHRIHPINPRMFNRTTQSRFLHPVTRTFVRNCRNFVFLIHRRSRPKMHHKRPRTFQHLSHYKRHCKNHRRFLHPTRRKNLRRSV